MRTLGLLGLLLLTLLWMLSGPFRSPEPAGAATFSVVSAGEASSCALTSSGGAIRCWGRNVEGELGIGTTTAPYTQTLVATPVCASGVWNGTTCAGGSALTGVYGISVGSSAAHSCATIVYLIIECWGYNTSGQVGNGTSSSAVLNPAYVQCQGASGSYCNSSSHILAGIVAVGAGSRHTCALDYTGYVWCWGDNGSGELGDGTTTGRSYATRVCATGSGLDCVGGTLLSGVTAIAVGDDFSCARLASGGVKCWGSNMFYQLGDGTTISRPLPVDVSGLTSGVASLSVGQAHGCVVLTTGGAKCWGLNSDGQLGDGTQTSRATPVSVTALTGVTQITAGTAHSCALVTSSPYVKCWGSQGFGQLGNSAPIYSGSAPTPVPWTTPTWGPPTTTALSAGALHTCAIISAYVECWGWNLNGQLGNNTADDTTTWVLHDTDKEGCTDAKELGPDQLLGGKRDPTNFWDFFDVWTSNGSGGYLRDKVVNSIDVAAVQARYFTNGNQYTDPLATPSSPTGYHSAFDRTDDPGSSEAWDLLIGDGLIRSVDINLVNLQAQPTPHSCQ